MKIKNTSKKDIHNEWLGGSNPSAIEAQELKGQKELCDSKQLPCMDGYKDLKQEYEKIGIKVLGKSKDDNLFYDVILPKGWKIVSTEHSMWSDLIDEKGKKIGNIFYKAAFYDRSADFGFIKEEKC